MRDHRRRNVLLLYLVAGLTSVSHASMELILPLNLDRLGHPLPLIGATVAMMGVGALLSRVPGGTWYRLSRARRLSVGALALGALATIGLAVGSAWPMQATLVLVHGFAYGLSTTFLMALLIDVRPQGEGAASTMAWYTATLSTAYAAGSSLGAQSTAWLGHDAGFAVSGLVGLVGAGIALALVLPAEEPADAAADASTPDAERGVRVLLSLPAGIWLAALLAFYMNVVNDTTGTFFPIYALSLGISLAAVGYFKSASFLAATGIRFGSAALFRVLDVRIANHASILTMALGMAALTVFTSEAALLTVFIAIGVSRGLLRVTSMTTVAEHRGRLGSRVGMASGVYNGGFDVAALLGAPLSGALAGALGIPAALRIVALTLPAAYYLVWFVQRTRAARSVCSSNATEERVVG